MTTEKPPCRRPAAGHAAPAGRILAAGVSASVAVGLVAVMAKPPVEDAVLTVAPPAQPAATAPPTTMAPRVVVVVVDDPPAAVPPPTVTVPAPPATLATRPAVTPATARPTTKTRAS